MISILSALAYACPLILCSLGALFSEYAGCLALFLDGLVSFSAFLFYTFSIATGSPFWGAVLASLAAVFITLLFSALIELGKGNRFIAAIALNLLFGALTSCISWLVFGTRGILVSDFFKFSLGKGLLITRAAALCITTVFATLALIFLKYSRAGLYLRITGSDQEVLKAKGINLGQLRTLSWCLAALYGSLAGILLTLRLSSFVPNISSGRGWMALAAVFLGKKKPLRIVAAVLIFCLADIFGANIQNYLPGIPSSLLLSLPYLVSLLLILVK